MHTKKEEKQVVVFDTNRKRTCDLLLHVEINTVSAHTSMSYRFFEIRLLIG